MAENLSLYVREGCPYCRKVRDYMEENDIKVPLKFIEKDEDVRRELVQKGGKKQVPCLFVDEQIIYESNDIINWMENNL